MARNPIRTLLILGLCLLAAALGLFVTLRLTDSHRAADVHIRWAANLDTAKQHELEEAYQLRPLEFREDRTWRYVLNDVSADNIRRLITDPAVEDTHHLDRTAFRVSPTAVRGAYTSSRAAWIAALIVFLIRAFTVLGAVALAAASLITWIKRRSPVSQPSLSRPRRETTWWRSVGLVLLAAALGLFVTLRVTDSQRAAYVHIRWAADLDAAKQHELEEAYRLTPLEFREDRTWLYALNDVSTDNIRRLIADPAVEDTHQLDRTAFRVSPTAARGAYTSSRAAWIAALTLFLIRAFAVLGAIALTAPLFRRWSERQNPAALRVGSPQGDRRGSGSDSAGATERPAYQQRYWWLLATLATTLPLLVALCVTMWRAPYPFGETVALLEDVGVLDDATALDSPRLRAFFDPTIRWWYRPFYHLTWYSFWHLTRSLGDTLTLFKLLEVGTVAVLVLLFISQLKPRTFADYAAASFAVAVLIGMPAFRENLEVPVLYTLVALPGILIVWMLLERDARAWHGPVILALLIGAIGFKEQGLIIAPLVVTAWWLGAPGATRGTAVVVAVAAMAYLAFRLGTSGSWAPFEQDQALGFTTMSAAEASERFGDFPLPMYVYNALSTVSNVLFSEPTAGHFSIVSSLVRGEAAPWELNHLLSSIALTGLILWWGISAWRQTAGQRWSLESRLFAAVIITVAASGVLGFNYTRDRLGGMATVFYAMAAYFAMRRACERTALTSGGWMAASCAGLLLLAGAWQVRAIGTIEGEHLRAAKVRREWMVDLHQVRVEMSNANKPRFVRILDAMAGQGTEPTAAPPTPYPSWATPWLREP
jgi:hypothetical protein